MVNSVDSDQTTPLGLQCLHDILSETLLFEISRHLPYLRKLAKVSDLLANYVCSATFEVFYVC